MKNPEVIKICSWLNNGEIVGMNTDTIYGLHTIVTLDMIKKLRRLKRIASSRAGFVVLGNSLEDFAHFLDLAQLNGDHLHLLRCIYDKPVSWVVPILPKYSELGSSRTCTMAIRITSNRNVRSVIDALHAPIISTSANLSDQMPLDANGARTVFGNSIKCLESDAQLLNCPSKMICILTKKILRE